MTDHSYKWEPSPHTADLAIAIEGSDKNALFHAAFDGFLGIQDIDRSPDEFGKITEDNFEFETGEIENALVDFLNECIYVMEVEEVIPFKIIELNYDSKILTARIMCRNIRNDERRELGHIKAATYSDLQVIEVDGKLTAKIVFDT